MLLASMGRYEEAFARADEMIALGRDMGRGVRVLLNYSTLTSRELYDLDEARRRSENALDGMPRTSFHMPWMNAEVDLVHVDLLAGEYGDALNRWQALWEPVLATTAWERWLLGGKLAAFRAQIALHTEEVESALDWAARAVEMARSSRRAKYLIIARGTLGAALLRAGRTTDAVRALTAAAAAADELGNPSGRWTAHAQLAAFSTAAGTTSAPSSTTRSHMRQPTGWPLPSPRTEGESSWPRCRYRRCPNTAEPSASATRTAPV